MGTFESLEQAREYFKNDRYAMTSGMHLDELYEDGSCLCSMTLTDQHKNALGGVMGGVIYTLADFAFAVACNQRHRPTVALEVNMHYLSMPRGEHLYARAACLKDGRNTCLYQVRLTDDTGREVALFVGTGFKLDPEQKKQEHAK
ncbi:MAG: PaaI family thioesterase [Clostridia bacterium]|nr:PaaI family thioesterase [Clostridia bacterium]